MAYVLKNSTTAGRIYDSFENIRMDDILKNQLVNTVTYLTVSQPATL